MLCGISVLMIVIFSHHATAQNLSKPWVLDKSDIFFESINKKIDFLINNLFECLHLPRAFKFTQKAQEKLKSYKSFKEIIKINHDIYNAIYQINKIENQELVLNQTLMEDIMKEEFIAKKFDLPNIDFILLFEFVIHGSKIRKKLGRMAPDLMTVQFYKSYLQKNNITTGEKPTRTTHNPLKINDPEINKTQTRRLNDEEESQEEDNSESKEIDVFVNGRRTYRGQAISVKKYSFIVSIHIDGKFNCAGSIISPEIVISAATCLQKLFEQVQTKKKLSTVTIRYGSDYYNESGYVVKASQAHFHPDYDPETLHNNLILLRVKKNSFAQVKWIFPIKYETKTNPYNPSGFKHMIKVIGWGKEPEPNEKKLPLSFDRLDMLNQEECENNYPGKYVKQNHFCGGYASKTAVRCKRDIGGPGIRSGTLLGIISYGTENCSTSNSAVTVFTRLGGYMSWINGILSDGDQNKTAESRKHGSIYARGTASSQNEEDILMSRRWDKIQLITDSDDDDASGLPIENDSQILEALRMGADDSDTEYEGLTIEVGSTELFNYGTFRHSDKKRKKKKKKSVQDKWESDLNHVLQSLDRQKLKLKIDSPNRDVRDLIEKLKIVEWGKDAKISVDFDLNI